ncbi:PREDICTED: uncharacterized protein LOC109187992 [Ipomoea nil]|uniref:uncharacterized protein LOC109187992 n=1 Tax=Ipomoea nil TaxID=35883 RepID=UPI000900BA87|nr:PREDICTED: uncharacterized protein LOC109187992 [Ipomoea nil]
MEHPRVVYGGGLQSAMSPSFNDSRLEGGGRGNSAGVHQCGENAVYIMERFRPLPQLTGDNYAYWKARTRTHLKAQGDQVWRAVLTGWTPPTKPGENDGDPPVIKPETERTQAEITTAGYNDKALDTIYSLMHENQFSLVTGIDCAKTAWEILETTYEGTSSVKQSKLQLVKTEFEELRLNEDEDIASFHGRLQELANRATILGKPFSQQKLVKKVLRSMPSRFRMKVTAIQEHDGWEDKSVAQLMGNLRTYEMEILTDHTKKQKMVAFVAEEQDDTAPNDDSVAFLTKQFSNFLKQVSQKNTQNNKHKKGTSTNVPKTGTKSGVSNSKNTDSRPARPKEKSNNKGIRCYECEGFGHVQAECPTYLRRKKSMTVTTWSDDELESENVESDAEEMFGNFVAFAAKSTICSEPVDASDTEGGDYNSAEDLDIPDISYEVEFNKLYPKWEALLKTYRVVSSEVRVLQNAVNVFKGQVADRDALIKDYTDREEKLQQEIKRLTLELNTYIKRIQMMDTTSTLDEILDSGRQSSARFSYVDTSDLSVITSTKNKGPKNIAISRDEKWYFDSGCSRHMTGNAKFLSDINTSNGEVTFGDGVKGQVTGVGTLNVAGLPKLKKVLLVNGLHANLISISQLCDQNWNVSFTKDNCSVMDNEKQCVMEGSCGKRFRKKQKGIIMELFSLFFFVKQKLSGISYWILFIWFLLLALVDIIGYYWISDYLFG